MTRHRMITAALLVVLGLSGCTPSAGAEEKGAPIADQVQASLAQQPGVVKAQVVYQNNVTAAKQVAASIIVKAGTAPSPVADEAVRLIWLSELTPLNSVTVTVTDEKNYTNNDRRDLRFEDAATKAELERKYGPRP